MISRAGFRRAMRRAVFTGLGVLVFVIWLLNHWVINNSEAYVYSSWSLLPESPVGLVLGTSPYTRDGAPNPQFAGRVDAAAQLYQLGKVRHLLISGTNSGRSYNEPRAMWKALMKRGVPQSAMTLDFAGDRTFDSVARAHIVFGLDRFTIITQRFHAYRAEFAAKKLHLGVVAYAAPGGDELGTLSRTRLREVLARVKIVLDIYVLHTQPRFGGDRATLGPAPKSEPTPPADADGPSSPDDADDGTTGASGTPAATTQRGI